MSKRKRRKSGSKKTSSVVKDLKASHETKVTRLRELQARRETRKYLKLLNGAESRLLRAQREKEEFAIKAERAVHELRAAEAYLNVVAKEVSEWENLGLVVETTFTDVEDGTEVIVAHKGDELGVKAVTANTDPELVYGVTREAAQAGEKVKIGKKNFEAVESVGGRFAETATPDQEVLDQLDDVVVVPQDTAPEEEEDDKVADAEELMEDAKVAEAAVKVEDTAETMKAEEIAEEAKTADLAEIAEEISQQEAVPTEV